MVKGRFSQFDEDEYRLPEGMRRIAYDADTQCYTFRDHSGQLYEGAPGAEFGVLRPVTAPLPHRRNVTITEIPDPALRRWSEKPAKTFGDILPSGYIAAAQPTTSPTRMFAAGEKFMRATIPKVRGVVEIVRRHTTLRRSARGGVARSDSAPVADEKRRLMAEEDAWAAVVRKDDSVDGRVARSKSEMRPPRYYSRK